MSVVKSVVFLLLQISLLNYVNTQRLSVALQKSYGTCNKNFCNISVVARPVNRTSKWSSMDIYFHKGVKLDAPIDLEVIANKKFGAVYRPHMLTFKEEFCSLINLKTHPIYQKYGTDKNLKNLGNLLDPCPVMGHRYMTAGYTSPKSYEMLPLIPTGEWRIDYVLSKNINNTVEEIVSVSDFYEIEQTTVQNSDISSPLTTKK